ncbi:RYR3 protein, partial [Sylvietta virens]|nr:RYR3 protein [Sylvietta virens]
ATLKELISQTMVRWSQEDQIQDPELVRIMYSLLRRQYDSIGELLQALRKAYTISAASVKDTINLLAALGQIRSLLSVRMGKEEELLMINGLGYGIKEIYSTGVLKFVMSCISSPLQVCIHLYLVNKCLKTIKYYLGITYFFHRALSNFLTAFCNKQIFHISPFFHCCRLWRQFVYCISRHIFLLPKFITFSFLGYSIMTNSVLQVVTYLAGCGLQSCPVLLAKGYPDIGWNPIEGERYLSFLRFAVFANSESVEENASVVVKLLIR